MSRSRHRKSRSVCGCVCVSVRTFSGEGWRAMLDGVELQQQPVQLGQVTAQG